jgi:large subunit ribosomal protein L1
MGHHGKKYLAAAARVDRDKAYPLSEALDLLLAARREKFDETAEAAINLGVDPRHAEQNVRGALVLPHGTGKKVRVIVFARGDKEREAREAGADEVGAEELAKRITDDNWLEFDRVIATPDMMGVVGRLGRVLGPRGLMPNPRVGTVTFDVGRAVEEQKGGKIAFRVDKAGIVHVPFGKASFSKEQLDANLRAVTDAVLRAKPATAKGTYFKKISISTTMGPGIRLDSAEFVAAAV